MYMSEKTQTERKTDMNGITARLAENRETIMSVTPHIVTGTATKEQIEDYKQAKEAMQRNFDMLTHPHTNNKTTAEDLAILAFAALDDAYFELLFHDTEAEPLTDAQRNLRDGLAKARSVLKSTFYDTMSHDAMWARIDAVTCAMK